MRNGLGLRDGFLGNGFSGYGLLAVCAAHVAGCVQAGGFTKLAPDLATLTFQAGGDAMGGTGDAETDGAGSEDGAPGSDGAGDGAPGTGGPGGDTSSGDTSGGDAGNGDAGDMGGPDTGDTNAGGIGTDPTQSLADIFPPSADFNLPPTGMGTYAGGFSAVDSMNRTFTGTASLDADFTGGIVSVFFSSNDPRLGPTEFSSVGQPIFGASFVSSQGPVTGTFDGGQINGGTLSGRFLGESAQAAIGQFDINYNNANLPGSELSARGTFEVIQ